MSEYLIRPHHLLCLQFFEGKGYSEEFVENMTEIHRTLHSENPTVIITEGVDDLCRKCPNSENGKCVKESSICENDNRTLEALNIKVNDRMKWNSINSEVKEKILDKHLVKDVCRTCRWSVICDKYIFLASVKS